MILSDILNMATESAELEARRLALLQQVESTIASADELARRLDGQDGPAIDDKRNEQSPFVILSRQEDGSVVLGGVTVEIFTPSASDTPRYLSGRATVSFYRGAIAKAEVMGDEDEPDTTVGGERVGQISPFYYETTHNDSMIRTLENQPGEEPFNRKNAIEDDVRVAEARAKAIMTSLGVISTAAGDATLNPKVS